MLHKNRHREPAILNFQIPEAPFFSNSDYATRCKWLEVSIKRYPCISQVPPDFDIISFYGGAVSFLSHITRESANFSQPVDKLWDIHKKLICYIFYTSEDAYW